VNKGDKLLRLVEALRSPEFEFPLPDNLSTDKYEQLIKKVRKAIGLDGYIKISDKKIYFAIPSYPLTVNQYKNIEKIIEELR